MITVNLECLTNTDSSVGIIAPSKTGVLWQNQVGGRATAYPALEGIYVPLPSTCLPSSDSPLYQLSPVAYDPSLVEKFLTAHIELQKLFEPSPIGATEQMISMAWVPLRVKIDVAKSFSSGLLSPFAGDDVVLTYPNM